MKGSARLDQSRRHLLSAVTHGTAVTIAQAEVGSKTNETRHFKPLLAPLDLAGAVITQLSTYERCPYGYYLTRVREDIEERPDAWLPHSTGLVRRDQR